MVCKVSSVSANVDAPSSSLTDLRAFLLAGALDLTGLGLSCSLSSSSSDSMTCRERFLPSGALRFLAALGTASLSLSLPTTIGLRLVDDGAGASSSDVRDESAAADRLSPSDVGGGVSAEAVDLDELARGAADEVEPAAAFLPVSGGVGCCVELRAVDEEAEALGALGSARLKKANLSSQRGL